MSPRNHATLANRYQSDGMAVSSPQKLVVLMFERIETDLARAVTAIDANQVEDAHNALINAQELVFELQLALDVEAWPGGVELQSIYEFLLSNLIDANLRKSADIVRQCIDIVTPLSQSWSEAYRAIQQGEAAASEAALAAQ
jgi:flagellar protein FliS